MAGRLQCEDVFVLDGYHSRFWLPHCTLPNICIRNRHLQVWLKITNHLETPSHHICKTWRSAGSGFQNTKYLSHKSYGTISKVVVSEGLCVLLFHGAFALSHDIIHVTFLSRAGGEPPPPSLNTQPPVSRSVAWWTWTHLGRTSRQRRAQMASLWRCCPWFRAVPWGVKKRISIKIWAQTQLSGSGFFYSHGAGQGTVDCSALLANLHFRCDVAHAIAHAFADMISCESHFSDAGWF